ncbi:Glutaredoxin 2 [Aphelenchoides fujianensis]|nr:Glutaredoxin 2 [Aphelenchoides fujianensis]
MLESAWSFIEKHGWYCLLGGFCCVLIYQKFLYDRVQNMVENRELEKQKKYDEDKHQQHRERMEAARARQQEEYSQQVQRELELERQKAEKRKELKYGLDGKADEPKLPERFDALRFVREEVAKKPVVVFSKSWCPFSRKAKQFLLYKYSVQQSDYSLFELDEHEHGDLIQDALQRETGGRSVPRVFVGGKFIGGGDDVERLHNEKKIAGLLREANVHFVDVN